VSALDGTRPEMPVADGELPPGFVSLRRSTAAVLAKLITDPLAVIPAESYDERVVLTENLGRRRIYVSDPALVHEALVRNADRLVKSDEMKQVLGTALGEGLLTADGPMWRWQRQALAPAFQHERLLGLLPSMITAAEATRDHWLALPKGARLNVGHEMMHTTFAIILETMLSGPQGIDAAEMESGVTRFLSATTWMFALAMLKAPLWVPFPGRGRAMKATRFMRRSLRGRIAARRHAAPSNDLIGMLLSAVDPETGRTMTDEEITDNILTFIGAGHETTAVALSWTFALLATNPNCAARVVAEVDRVTGSGPVTPAHIAELVYTKQVINETMRLYPPAPLIARTVETEFELAGVPVPAGCTVFVPIFAIHRHRSLWTQPERFDPDRFAPEAVRARHRFAFLPFGAGPRICIGASFATMEAVAILAVLVKALRLELEDSSLPEPNMAVTLRPRRPMRMRVVPR